MRHDYRGDKRVEVRNRCHDRLKPRGQGGGEVLRVDKPRYVLISPVRNEERHLEATVRSVMSQVVRPFRWVIVSDGSTDQTDAIIRHYEAESEVIVYVRKESDPQMRSFASKVHAIRLGYERLSALDFDYVGNLDGDVTFGPDYFQKVLGRFAQDPRLGIAGGLVYERVGQRYVPQKIDSKSVAGAVQLFRRRCYEDICGYLPLGHGGVDAAAEIMARMNGWGVETVRQVRVLHHRKVAHASGPMIAAGLRRGRMYHSLGYHPIFEAVRCLYRLRSRPYIIGSMSELAGYLVAAVGGKEVELPPAAVLYLREEQLRRLRQMFCPFGGEAI